MTTITVQHVHKRFEQSGIGAVTAIADLSLKIPSGEVLAIVGPSGCGKSTLLRMIAGLIAPDIGEILYDNVRLAEIPLEKRGIGMVFQEGGLVPHWETRRTVGFFFNLRKRPDEIPPRVQRISQITGFDLDTLLDRRPGHLSGGERQRVAIARALTREPRVFLFDEPFSHIDAKLRGQGRIELKRLLNEFPVTSVYVTHDQTEAVSLASKIAVMRDGAIEQVGAYHDLYRNPINRFVAGFIGSPTMNLFEGEARGGRWQGAHFGGLPIRVDLPDGARVTLGVRPEAIRLAAPGETAVRAIVEEVTPYYAERFTLAAVRAANEPPKSAERWTMHTSPEDPPRAGDWIDCAIEADAALFFDTLSGRRIG